MYARYSMCKDVAHQGILVPSLLGFLVSWLAALPALWPCSIRRLGALLLNDPFQLWLLHPQTQSHHTYGNMLTANAKHEEGTSD